MRGAAPIVAITGCTRGLGLALAEYFAEEGWSVVGCGRNVGAIEQLRTESGPSHDFAVVDITDDTQVAAWQRHVFKRFGAVNLLLNNAAVIARNAPIWEVPKEEIDAVLEVNVAGTINVLRHFLPPMIERSQREQGWRGVVVNFSSGWGRSTSPDVGIYCASKWAIEGLTQSLSQDLADKLVRAYALNPGIVDTEMLRECFGAGAGHYPGAEVWVRKAGPYLKALLEKPPKNGAISITVPEVPVD